MGFEACQEEIVEEMKKVLERAENRAAREETHLN
jgi:hypothetical protein